MIIKKTSWSVLKAFATSRNASINFFEDVSSYEIYAIDGFLAASCNLIKGSVDAQEFDGDYKDSSNAKIETPKDSDGSPLQRPKITTSGWKAQFHVIRISTSTEGGVRNKDRLGNDLGFCTYKMYDSNGAETSIPSLCAKSMITWETNYDMEIVGGELFQATPPATDVWMYVTAAAHIPAQYGGSVAFLEGGMNLADVGVGRTVDFDGKAPKWIAHDPVNHSGRFTIEFQHDAGIQHSFSLIFKIYKP